MRARLALLAVVAVLSLGAVAQTPAPDEIAPKAPAPDLASVQSDLTSIGAAMAGSQVDLSVVTPAPAPTAASVADSLAQEALRLAPTTNVDGSNWTQSALGDIEAEQIRLEEAKLEAQRQAALAAERERMLAQVRALQAAVQAEQDAIYAENQRRYLLDQECGRQSESCHNRCHAASNAAIAAGIIAATQGVRTNLPSIRDCTSRCQSEESICRQNARAGQSYRERFTGGGALAGLASIMGQVSPSGAASGGYGAGYGGGGGVYGATTASSMYTPACQNAQARAEQEINAAGRQAAATGGICATGRAQVAISEAGLRYLRACPQVDPTGRQAQVYQADAARGREIVASSCAP